MNQTRLLKMCFLGLAVLAWFTPGASFGQGFPGGWKAKWIWIEGEAHPYHSFVMFRRSFDVDTMSSKAALHITAADRYIIYLNGKYMGRGPARSDARKKSFDTYDVSSRLRSGSNTLAVLAYHYGCENAYTRDERAGLFAQLEMTTATGERVIGTDGQWQVHQARAWDRSALPINGAVGVTEIYDANADPINWTAPEFDASSWDRAYVIPTIDCPWIYLESRQTPMLKETEIFPAQVVKAAEVMELKRIARANEIPERLAAEPHFPLQYARLENAQAALKADEKPATLQPSPFHLNDMSDKGVRSPILIVDFGRAVFGFPRVRLKAAKGAVIDMTYGAGLINGRIQSLAGGLRYGDRYICSNGEQVWQPFEYKQFRYLQLIVRDTDQPVEIDSISLISYEYPAERRGSFECSDPLLTQLWKACIDTEQLHMEDTLICDAIRERRCWAGDGAHGVYGVWAGFGDLPISDYYFRLIARGRMSDGMLRMFYPGSEQRVGGSSLELQNFDRPGRARPMAYETPLNIPQHVLIYLLILTGENHDYFDKQGLMKELYPTLAGAIEWFNQFAEASGLLVDLPYWQWMDWSTTDMRGANFQSNAVYYQVLSNASRIARELGHTDDAERWAAAAEKVRNSLRTLHWDDHRGQFVDSVADGKQSEITTELSNALAVLYGIASEPQASRIMQSMTNPDSKLVRSTPLFYYYVLEGLIAGGAEAFAYRQMAERFRPMLEASDNPTMWEFWNHYVRARSANVGHDFFSGEWPSWVHSGSVGPAWTLSKHVLGVAPVAAGFSKCRIQPQPGDLKWARGVFPSARGDIKVDWRKSESGLSLSVQLPDELETEIVMMRDAGRKLKLVHDGESHFIGPEQTTVPGIELGARTVRIKVSGGKHEFKLEAE